MEMQTTLTAAGISLTAESTSRPSEQYDFECEFRELKIGEPEITAAESELGRSDGGCCSGFCAVT